MVGDSSTTDLSLTKTAAKSLKKSRPKAAECLRSPNIFGDYKLFRLQDDTHILGLHVADAFGYENIVDGLR